jgi:Rod binding domain-containing protein
MAASLEFGQAARGLTERSAPVVPPTAKQSEARKAAENFESFFLSQVLENMFSGVETDGPFGGGFGEGIYRSLLLQNYGDVIARRGGVGIADSVMRQLIQQQEGVQP